MTPFNRFKKNMLRAEKAAGMKNDEMKRYGIVLGVAAMDDYFTNKFCDELVPFIKEKGVTPDLLEIFKNANFNFKDALELLVDVTKDKTKRPLRLVRSRIEKSLATYTTQQFDTIDNLFKAYGRSKLTENALELVGSKKLLEGSGLKKPYNKRIQELIQRRHKIVHSGDLDGHSKIKSIDKKWVLPRLRAVKHFVECAEEIIK